ncbi:MAG: L-seryl-tRNA(Sec) selenium transferase [Betaproteobacteria bacterium]|nr:L-seryl-tRNA(Sec) selenium transferase [Betaproteobacteria bacterium]
MILAALPSIDRVLMLGPVEALIAQYGRAAVVAAVRGEVDRLRTMLGEQGEAMLAEAAPERIAAQVAARLQSAAAPTLKRVFNLSGTILHTNLGRAMMPREVAEAIAAAATGAVNLEFDLETGKRDDRDRHLESVLVRMTGAEKATVVNNNAAAVLLLLNTLAQRREVVVSRGELIEIGGEFRMPEIMKRAGCRLVEVGTTNRTHLRDYAEAIGPRTALVMKVHPSNFEIVGFTKSVDEAALSALARERGVPLACDLGAGALVDFRRWGLPYENTAAAMIAAGVDLVTFSGDKLLGGPQAGLIAGRGELVERINRNPLKRALRVDKLRVAALEATLRIYSDPDRLAERLPVLRQMSRAAADIEVQAQRLLSALAQPLAGIAAVTIEKCDSQAGSGSLPSERLPSFALALRPCGEARKATARVEALSRAFRSLPVPVIGRVSDGVLRFDLRCLEDEQRFLGQLEHLRLNYGTTPP